MTADLIVKVVCAALVLGLVFSCGQVFGLLLGMEVVGRNSRSRVIRWMAKGIRATLSLDARQTYDEGQKESAPDPEPIPVAPVMERLNVPSFGRPELIVFRNEDYEEWLRCCTGGELLVQGQEFYSIPINNGEGILALCLDHRQTPAKEKTS